MATNLNKKIRLVFIPYLIIALSVLLVYSALRYLLSEKWGVVSVSNYILDSLLPFIIAAFLVLKYLKRRIKLLNVKGSNSNGYFIYNVIAIFAITIPTSYLQDYVCTAPYKLHTVNSLNDIDTLNLQKYYKIGNYKLVKDQGVVGGTMWVSGEFGQKYNYSLYTSTPMLDSIKPSYRVTYWYARKYDVAISKYLDKYEKKWAFERFANNTEKDYERFEVNYNCYYEVLRPSAAYDAYKGIVRTAYPYIGNHWTIILKPVFTPFEKRSGNALLFASISFLSGALIFLLMVCIPGLKKSELRKYEKGWNNATDDLTHILSFLIPGQHGLIVTPILILSNLTIYLLIALVTGSISSPSPEALYAYGGNNLSAIVQGQFWRLFTYMFLHAGLNHIVSNMFVLGIVGSVLEPIIKRKWMVATYLFTGLSAGISSLMMHPDSVGVGASGAIFGLYGALLALLITKTITTRIRKTYWGIIFLYAGGGLILGIQGNVDNASHIGGLISGILAGLLYWVLYRNPLPAKNDIHSTTP